MKINVRTEGGIGDHLLANRFIPAIKEYFEPVSDGRIEFHMFSDAMGNPRSSELLCDLFDWWSSATVIQTRKDENFRFKNPFGNEVYPAHIDNIPDDIKEKMTRDCDAFFDLHVDGLKWQHYTFPWQRYFFSFPQPKGYSSLCSKRGFVLCHLYSRKDSPYLMEEWYVKKLIKELSKDNYLVLVADPHNQDSIDFNNRVATGNCQVVTPDMKEVFSLAGKCLAFIGIDSGIRYVPYHFCKPTFVFSKYCSNFGQVAHSHLVRWLLFKDCVFPLHAQAEAVRKILNQSIISPLGGMFSTTDAKFSFIERF